MQCFVIIKQNQQSCVLYNNKFAVFCAHHANYYWCGYLMDQDLNNMNQLYGDHDSFHFPGSTQDRTIRKSSFDIKHMEHLISPANIPVGHRSFMQSPTPFKQNVNFYEQEQSDQHQNRESFSIEPRRSEICTIINFNESPNKKNYQYSNGNTAYTHRISNPQIKLLNLSAKEEKKNSKGLRSLSQNVYRIVLDLKITTYKQVADQLVKMLNAGQFGPFDQDYSSKGKDQQNIKRRVYDALNVLISADVLKKNGKHVMSQQQDSITQKVKSTNRNGKKEDKDNLLDQILKKQNQIKEKKLKIKELQQKKQILNAILKRNKKKKSLQKQKIMFPVIGLTYKKPVPKIIRVQNNSKALMPIYDTLEVFGDIDLLMKLEFDLLNQKIQQVIQEDHGQDLESEQPAKKKVKIQPSATQSRQRVSRVLYSL